MFTKRHALTAFLAVAALATWLLAPAASADSNGAGGFRTYEVTISNDTGGQPMTPPLASTHKQQADVYDVGSPASIGVQEIAENGNLGPALDERNGNAGVFDVVVGFPDPMNPGPLLPGESTTFQISADGGARWFSFVSMLVCTNDGFTGVDAIRLPDMVGDIWTADLAGYDAGTEANTENLSDLVPPCAAPAPGTGTSNPNLAQDGVVAPHGGITGTGSLGFFGNLDPAVRGWSDLGTITIERTG